MWLVVGLGNPGSQYQGNRHNVGFMVVDELARRAKAPAGRTKFGAEITEGTLGGEKVLFCKPMEFMNVSGGAVSRAATFWKIAPKETIVLHDELDLPFARLKLGAGGGHGGHNGLRSIIADWGSADFLRVRIGIGRPAPGHDVAAYVLANFRGEELKELPFLVNDAADAAETIVRSGLTTAMNKFNTNKKKKQEEAS